jgi:sugar phosphate isomerase/epimerase
MQDQLAAYCLVGIVHPMAFPETADGEGPIVETLSRIAADAYFSAVEVTQMKNAKVRAEAARVLATAGMDVIFAAQPALLRQGLSLCDPEPAKRQKAVDACKAMIDQAYELGASILALVSGPDPGESSRPQAAEALVDSLKQLCADAQEKTVERMLTISLENFDRDVDKRCLIGPTQEAAQVAEAIKAEYSNFGLTIDLSHQALLRESVEEMVLAAVDHLVHVHVGNCVRGSPSPLWGPRRGDRRGGAEAVLGGPRLRRILQAQHAHHHAGRQLRSLPRGARELRTRYRQRQAHPHSGLGAAVAEISGQHRPCFARAGVPGDI